MELHPVDVELLVSQSHDHPTLGPSRDLETIRQGLALHDQGMITRSLKRVLQALENTLALVMNHRGLAMHQFPGPHHLPAVNLSDRLMPEADPEDRKLASEGLDYLAGNARLVGRAGPRRNANPRRLQVPQFLHRDGIIPKHFHLRTQLPEILHEVVGEGVVVIDDNEHGNQELSGCWQAKHSAKLPGFISPHCPHCKSSPGASLSFSKASRMMVQAAS